MKKTNNHFAEVLFFNFVLIGSLISGILLSTFYFGLDVWLVFVFVAIIAVSWILARHANEPLSKSSEIITKLLRESIHELNMPLSTIEANIAMLKKNVKDEKNLKRLERIHLASMMLQERYEEVEYTLKAEFATIEKEDFYLDELIVEKIKRYEELFEGYKFVIVLEKLQVYADRRGFLRVIDNLLSNAVKYSKKGALISVKLKDKKFYVKDEGIGMDEVELLQIYDRYFQADAQSGGMGLGLSLVKSYCDKHKISINIESKKSVGTTVVLSLDHLTHN